MIPSAEEANIRQEMIPYMCTENQSVDEIKQRLLCTNFELITTRMQANTEIRKYEDSIKRLFQLLKRVCQERDEARDQLQQLQRKFQPSTKAETNRSTSTSQLQSQRQFPHKLKPLSSTEESDKSPKSKASSYHSYDLSLANSQTEDGHSSMGFSNTIAESSNFLLAKQANHQNRTSTVKAEVGPSRDIGVDSASIVIDKLAWGKPLPQKGRLLHSVTEAGPLLQTLLVAPLPQWRNPPPMSSPCISHSVAQVDDKATVNANGAIPTSLSLTFPGNSRPASQMSSASSSGISVKNEPLPYMDMDSNMMHNQLLARKKIKLL